MLIYIFGKQMSNCNEQILVLCLCLLTGMSMLVKAKGRFPYFLTGTTHIFVFKARSLIGLKLVAK